MKYYLAFIFVSDNLRKKIKGFQGMVCPLNWEYDADTEIWFSLYAWTTNKKIMKRFKKQRNSSIFSYKVIERDKIDTEFETSNSNLKLNDYMYLSNSGEEEMIISTGFEASISCDEGLIIEQFFTPATLPDPEILTDEFLYLLERFGYSYMFFNYAIDPSQGDYLDDDNVLQKRAIELGNRQDVFWDTYSYMDRINWKYYNERNMECNAIKINEFEAFVNLFGELFKN